MRRAETGSFAEVGYAAISAEKEGKKIWMS